MLALLSLLLAAAHPLLFFNVSDVPSLRAAAQSTHTEIAAHITAILNQHLGDPAPTPTDYDDLRFEGNQVAVWAFGYQLTGNTAYASMVRTQLMTYLGWSARSRKAICRSWPPSLSSPGASCKGDGAPLAVHTGDGGPAAPPALCYGDGKLAWLLQREGEGRA